MAFGRERPISTESGTDATIGSQYTANSSHSSRMRGSSNRVRRARTACTRPNAAINSTTTSTTRPKGSTAMANHASNAGAC